MRIVHVITNVLQVFVGKESIFITACVSTSSHEGRPHRQFLKCSVQRSTADTLTIIPLIYLVARLAGYPYFERILRSFGMEDLLAAVRSVSLAQECFGRSSPGPLRFPKTLEFLTSLMTRNDVLQVKAAAQELEEHLAQLLRENRGGVIAALVASCGRLGTYQKEVRPLTHHRVP